MCIYSFFPPGSTCAFILFFHQEVLLTMAGVEIRREDVVLPEDQADRLAFVLHNVLTPEVMRVINSIFTLTVQFIPTLQPNTLVMFCHVFVYL